ncbi:NADH-quinone oxidoreductase subunit J [Phycicoccus sp. Soil748]|uniref:NADH-quinone oxidoreductase subunit J family protein n=1 Tax=Phycicoccus sp. Soil748 TaxID=1736397 RepID=UPI000702514A|nr:NADH-quinone oxidoreductase subunit J [Phycicoccus sp. Soil748]KRE58683.1 NADH dehydrogenase [Phycicoccus sp. Soil748]
MTGLDLAFAAVGVVAAASGLLAVTTRHVVHAALWLVVCLGSVAGCYLVLGAELVALVQVLVYVGAVVVLVLFALMLTRAPIGPRAEISTSRLHRALAAVLGAGVTVLLASVLLPLAHPVDRHETDTTVLSRELFGTWVWPFEVLSLLLLAALVAALAVSRVGARSGDVRDGAARAEAELRTARGDAS